MARYSSVFSGGASSDALVFWNAGAIPTGWYFKDIGTGVFFDSVKLQNPAPFDHNWNPIVNQAMLLSGKRSVQGSTEKALSVSFRCQTGIHTHISDLKDKIGGAYTLKIDDESYENCYIVAIRDEEWFPGEFEYTVSFVQDTS